MAWVFLVGAGRDGSGGGVLQRVSAPVGRPIDRVVDAGGPGVAIFFPAAYAGARLAAPG